MLESDLKCIDGSASDVDFELHEIINELYMAGKWDEAGLGCRRIRRLFEAVKGMPSMPLPPLKELADG